MGRRVDLRQLVPDEDDRDIVVMPDGKEFFLPRLGVHEMSDMLLMEEGLSRRDTFANLGKMNDKLVAILRRENPGKGKVPDYDMTVQEIMSCIAAFSGAGSVAEAVRAAIAGSGDDDEVPSEDAALEAARQLAEGAGLRDGTEEPPLGSAKPSRKRSSRSGTSARGGHSGGKKSAGTSSRRTSSKRATSKPA